MARIRFENISKGFGKVEAVRDFSLQVEDKEFLTLVGPSGSGKSTLLNLLAGLEDPTAGRIYIDDELVNHVPPGRRDISMVFQSYALYPHMSVRENIGFGLKVRKLPKAEVERRVKEASDILGIGDLLDRRPAELSGGQRQRVALGRAITRDPKVFLLDEPLSNLDAKLRIYMRAELKLLFQRLGGTVVYVTHDQVEAMTMSDRVVVLNQGVAQQVGPPMEIYRRPQNIFVAGFLGSPPINLIEARLQLSESGLKLKAPDIRLPLNPSVPGRRLQTLDGQRIVMGIRPEDIEVTSSREDAIPCDVLLIEPLGSLSVVHVRLGEQRLVLTRDADAILKSGDQIHVRISPRKVHLFEAETGQRIEV